MQPPYPTLKELADIVEKTEAGGPLGEVEEWNHVELEQNLTHFSMLNNCPPGIVESGAWCCSVSRILRKVCQDIWRNQ